MNIVFLILAVVILLLIIIMIIIAYKAGKQKARYFGLAIIGVCIIIYILVINLAGSYTKSIFIKKPITMLKSTAEKNIEHIISDQHIKEILKNQNLSETLYADEYRSFITLRPLASDPDMIEISISTGTTWNRKAMAVKKITHIIEDKLKRQFSSVK